MKTIINGAVALATASVLAGTASASVLTSKLSVDNGYIVYISTSNTVAGTSFGSGENWNATYIDSTSLAAGTDYYLHIMAYDTGGIASVLGEFSLAGAGHHFANGSATLTTETTSWLGNSSGFSSAYTALTDQGANGVGPWGYNAQISGSARWIWSGDAYGNDVSYLSARILADAPAGDVPEPASLALLGGALLAMRLARAKKR